MDAEFITSTSKLTLKNETIWEKRIVQPEKSYWYHSFIFLLIFIGYSTYRAINERAFDWLYVLLGLVWIAPHLKRIYKFVFVKVWRWYVPLSEIRTVEVEQNFNELEQKVIVLLKNGRKKEYIFRRSENQTERFVELIASMSPNVSLQTVWLATANRRFVKVGLMNYFSAININQLKCKSEATGTWISHLHKALFRCRQSNQTV